MEAQLFGSPRSAGFGESGLAARRSPHARVLPAVHRDGAGLLALGAAAVAGQMNILVLSR